MTAKRSKVRGSEHFCDVSTLEAVNCNHDCCGRVNRRLEVSRLESEVAPDAVGSVAAARVGRKMRTAFGMTAAEWALCDNVRADTISPRHERRGKPGRRIVTHSPREVGGRPITGLASPGGSGHARRAAGQARGRRLGLFQIELVESCGVVDAEATRRCWPRCDPSLTECEKMSVKDNFNHGCHGYSGR